MLIENVDQRSKDYGEIARAYRPGHADYVYQAKYGVRDHRGGGRSSARETALRVAAGAVARLILGSDIAIRAGVVQIGPHRIPDDALDFDAVQDNPLFAASAEVVQPWSDYLDGVRKAGSSIGAVVALEVTGVPVGWGAPLYAKLDAELAAALMSINAAKGVEIGAGFASAELSGEDNADEMRMAGNAPAFLSNNAGGILGGISTGQDIVVCFAVKPTSSILTPRKTVDTNGNDAEISTKGRHDPCVGIRAGPGGEAMMACVLLDHILMHRGQIGGAVGDTLGRIG